MTNLFFLLIYGKTKGCIPALCKKVLMLSIIFLLLFGLCVLSYLFYQQKRDNYLLTETIQELKEIQEVKEIQAYLEGRDQERTRIVEDWHDGIGNSLATLKLIIDTIQPKDPERHIEALSLLEHTQREFRQIIDDEIVNDFSDKVAIVQTFEKWTQRLQFGNIKLVFKVYDLKLYNKYQLNFKSHLYRMVQELLSNIIKHANASQIKVEIWEENRCLFLTMEDNGIGLKKRKRGQNIMRSIQRRLMLLKGKMTLYNELSSGTNIQILLPLDVN